MAMPKVECVARARMPTTFGMDVFLHVYQNDLDEKEHMAIVFGGSYRSRSLHVRKKGETEVDRIIRGAYPGRLTPGSLSYIGHPGNPDLPTQITGRPGTIAESIRSLQDRGMLNGVSTLEHPWEGHGRFCVGNDTTVQDPPNIYTATEASGDAEPPLVRIHSECCTGEHFWSTRCDCGEQLDEAGRLMSSSSSSSSPSSTSSHPGGIIVYLRQEGRGIGLVSKLKACNLQDLGFDTVDANLLLGEPVDGRCYKVAASILLDLGCGGGKGIKLLTNNLDKVRAFESFGNAIKVRERVPMTPLAWKTSGIAGIRSKEIQQYIHAKVVRMGHIMGKDSQGEQAAGDEVRAKIWS